MTRKDVILAGAGLSNRLLALRLKALRPELDVLLVDSAAPGALPRTWSFHGSDVEDLDWVRAIASRSWRGYQVRFPEHERTLDGSYHSIRSEELEARADAPFMKATIRAVEPGRAILDDGTVLEAGVVIDGRGAAGPARPRSEGYQKFAGIDVELESPHGLERPLLMDARVPQIDGFRFIYVLPWDERRLLIEDTRYSSDPSLDPAALRAEITAYAESRGWRIARAAREERGVLPIPFSPPRARPGLRVGAGAGLFHPVTGYSLPWAARAAEAIARLPRLDIASVAGALDTVADPLRARAGFYGLLNRMMFQAAAPESRYRVLERFYALQPALIARFYRAENTLADCARILTGRPPVPLLPALRCIRFKTEELS